jgi:hypothetical protein
VCQGKRLQQGFRPRAVPAVALQVTHDDLLSRDARVAVYYLTTETLMRRALRYRKETDRSQGIVTHDPIRLPLP